MHIRIAEGIGSLGPSTTLNTVVGALVIGTGTLSGTVYIHVTWNYNCNVTYLKNCQIDTSKITKMFAPRKKRLIIFKFATSSHDHLECPDWSCDILHMRKAVGK